MLVGDGSKNGIYYALDARTGKLAWKTQMAPGGSFGGVLGSAALADGRLVVPANVGNLPGSRESGRARSWLGQDRVET